MPKTEPWRNRIIGHGTEAPDQLLANPKNFRIHPKNQQDALSGVLNEIGWIQSVIVNQRTGFVIDGHLRVALAISHGDAEMPVVYVDLSDEEEALALASIDPISAMAAVDKELLDSLLRDVSSADAGVQQMLSDLAEKNGLHFGGEVEPGEGGDEFDATPDDGPTRCQSGDLWLIGGRHRLLCGDSTDSLNVDRLFGDDRAAIVWTDPPYGVDYGEKNKALNKMDGGSRIETTISSDDLSAGRVGDLISGALRGAAAHTMLGATAYISGPGGPGLTAFIGAMTTGGFPMRGSLVWVKNSHVFGRSLYHYRHEIVLFGWKADGAHYEDGNRSVNSVFQVNRPNNSDDHPTMKPIALIEPMLVHSSPKGSMVYDPFLGSGSTLIAAHRTGRRCYGIELSPKYADVILRRAEAEGLTVERIGTESPLIPELA